MSSGYEPVGPLTAQVSLDDFDCGSDAQTDWLRRHALQSHLGGMSRVFVVTPRAENRVVAFYALSTGSVVNRDAPLRVIRGAGQYDIPVIVLTRLGVDRRDQRRGLGRALVVDALRRVDRVANEVGVRALLIHCENDAARSFYSSLASFEQSPIDELHLLLVLKDLRRAITRA